MIERNETPFDSYRGKGVLRDSFLSESALFSRSGFPVKAIPYMIIEKQEGLYEKRN